MASGIWTAARRSVPLLLLWRAVRDLLARLSAVGGRRAVCGTGHQENGDTSPATGGYNPLITPGTALVPHRLPGHCCLVAKSSQCIVRHAFKQRLPDLSAASGQEPCYCQPDNRLSGTPAMAPRNMCSPVPFDAERLATVFKGADIGLVSRVSHLMDIQMGQLTEAPGATFNAADIRLLTGMNPQMGVEARGVAQLLFTALIRTGIAFAAALAGVVPAVAALHVPVQIAGIAESPGAGLDGAAIRPFSGMNTQMAAQPRPLGEPFRAIFKGTDPGLLSGVYQQMIFPLTLVTKAHRTTLERAAVRLLAFVSPQMEPQIGRRGVTPRAARHRTVIEPLPRMPSLVVAQAGYTRISSVAAVKRTEQDVLFPVQWQPDSSQGRQRQCHGAIFCGKGWGYRSSRRAQNSRTMRINSRTTARLPLGATQTGPGYRLVPAEPVLTAFQPRDNAVQATTRPLF